MATIRQFPFPSSSFAQDASVYLMKREEPRVTELYTPPMYHAKLPQMKLKKPCDDRALAPTIWCPGSFRGSSRRWDAEKTWEQNCSNRLFLSCLLPPCQNESSREIFHMKMSLVYR